MPPFMDAWASPSLFQGSKVLAKKELAYVPIIGWMWYFTEMVFCTRKWEQDRKTVSESLLHLRDYPEKYFVRAQPAGRPVTLAHARTIITHTPGVPRPRSHTLRVIITHTHLGDHHTYTQDAQVTHTHTLRAIITYTPGEPRPHSHTWVIVTHTLRVPRSHSHTLGQSSHIHLGSPGHTHTHSG